MFKSIFSRYVIAFILIVVVSYAAIALIVANISDSTSERERNDSIKNAAESLRDYIENGLHSAVPSELSRYVISNYYTSLLPAFRMLGSYDENLVLALSDASGKILISDKLVEKGYPIPEITMPESLINDVKTQGLYSGETDIPEIFNEKQLVYALSVKNKDSSFAGVIFAFTSNTNTSDLASLLAKTIITAMLWVMVISMLTVFIISERISSPLRKMSKAVKEFSGGDFSSRVRIKGNDEIAELASNFNNMADSIENSEKMRSIFLSNIAHDLRTPMTSISGFVEGMLDGAIPPEKYEHYLAIVNNEVKRLSRLVSSLLDITKYESGERKLNYSDFDICEMARQIVISFENKIESKKLDVEFDTDKDNIYVNADRDAVYQVLYNICDNAVKFSEEGGKYRVGIKTRDKKVFVSVYNEGKGIAAEELPFVFDRFYKTDKSRGLDSSGVGLGLFISKTIIEAHRQKIWAESVEGKYCEFVFTLNPSEQ